MHTERKNIDSLFSSVETTPKQRPSKTNGQIASGSLVALPQTTIAGPPQPIAHFFL